MKVFSGIQPTGELHLGNLFGAIQSWVELQERADCIYSVVDYHAITLQLGDRELAHRTLNLAGDLIACGIDPERSILFVQSHVPEHTELTWILDCVASYGDLGRMTQFKDKAEGAEFISVGLFNYPVLQAADILLYRADRVPVGEDQVQHVELSRRIARRFNNLVGEDFFPEIEPMLSPAKRIMSLADPSRKMSKSLGPSHYIGLMEEPNEVWKKVRSAVTDSGGEASDAMSPGVENLFAILRSTAPEEAIEPLVAAHRDGSLRYKDLKEAVRDHLEATLGPIRERRQALSDDEIRNALESGAERAGAIARATMSEVRRLIGVGPESI